MEDVTSNVRQKIRGVQSTPSLPRVTARVLERINQSFSSFGELERIIRADVSLSAQLIRFANTLGRRHTVRLGSLEQAIKWLGLERVRSIAVSHAVEQEYTSRENAWFPRAEFWRYSLASGLSCEIVAEELGYTSKRLGRVFSAGHLHAVGRTLIDQHAPEAMQRIAETMRDEDCSMFEAENRILDTNHCLIGADVFKHWKLPDSIVRATRHYYDQPVDGGELASIVHLASVLTKTKNYGYSGDDSIEYFRPEVADHLDLEVSWFRRIVDDVLPRRYSDIKPMLHFSERSA